MRSLKRHNLFYAATIAAAIFILYACSRSDDAVDPSGGLEVDRKELLTNVADNIVIPAYARFKIKLDAMTGKSNEFTRSPNTTTLAAFRAAWVDAYTEWQRVELFDFGPAQVKSMRSYFNIYPASESAINSNMSNIDVVNMDVPAAFPTQGFPALDYLINGLASSDADIVAFYISDANASKRIAYLKQIITRMNAIFSSVQSEWTNGYRDTFVEKTAVDAGSSLSLMVNGYILNYERYIRSGKFGIPSGALATTGGATFPDKVEAYYKRDISAMLAKTAHQASVDFFNDASLKTYLDALDAKDVSTGTMLSTMIQAQFAAAATKLGLLPADLSETVETNNQLMLDVYNELQKTVRMLKVDMTSAISITISFTDNDGD